MSREQQQDRIKQLEALQDRIASGEPLCLSDRIACWWGVQGRINSYKEHLYAMEGIWEHKKYAPEGFVEEKILAEQAKRSCPLGETPVEDVR